MATTVLPETTRALYPFKSRYFTLSDGIRMHYIDEGPGDGPPLIFFHGYPTWSFAYRALIVCYAAQGYRCLAMDHVGYGLSDKPTSRRYHTLRRHIYNAVEFIQGLGLRNVTLVMEDWGVAFALGYAIRHPENVQRLVIMNSWVFTYTSAFPMHPVVRLVAKPGIGELLFGVLNLAFPLGLQRWTARQLSPAVMTAYRAPFREARQRVALFQFPRMIGTHPNHPSTPLLREIEEGLNALRRVPTLIVWGAENPVFPPLLARHWKTRLQQVDGPHLIPGARHYLTEDNPDALMQHLDAFLAKTETREGASAQ